MYNFREAAKAETTMSELMQGREKVTTDYIIRNYPTGVTIVEFDMITTEGKTFPVLAFREDDKKFFMGGTVITNICLSWVKAFEGDIKGASEALKASGGVTMILSAGRTKKGNNVTNVQVL